MRIKSAVFLAMCGIQMMLPMNTYAGSTHAVDSGHAQFGTPDKGGSFIVNRQLEKKSSSTCFNCPTYLDLRKLSLTSVVQPAHVGTFSRAVSKVQKIFKVKSREAVWTVDSDSWEKPMVGDSMMNPADSAIAMKAFDHSTNPKKVR